MFDRVWKVLVLVCLMAIVGFLGVDAYMKYVIAQELKETSARLEAQLQQKTSRFEDDLAVAKKEFRRLNDTLDFFVELVEGMLGTRPLPDESHPPKDGQPKTNPRKQPNPDQPERNERSQP